MKICMRLFVVVVLCLSLVGCAGTDLSNLSKSQQGMGLGAVAGAFVGNNLMPYSSLTSTVVGAVIGAGAGWALGSMMDERDRQKVSSSFDEKAGKKVNWKNEETGKEYTAVPNKTYKINGKTCRDVNILTDDGTEETITACKDKKGVWQTVNKDG